MNSNAMRKIVRLDEKELHELTKEVKETVAADVQQPVKKGKHFTAAQMWARRRRMRSASSRIRL